MGVPSLLVELHDLPGVEQRRIQIALGIHADPLGRIGEARVHLRAIGRCGLRRGSVGHRGVLGVLSSVIGSGLGTLHRLDIFFLRDWRNLRHLGLLRCIRNGVLGDDVLGLGR